VYSIIKVGSVIDGAVFDSRAFDETPDHVESQASGEQSRAKPTEP
jgi:hypothetical protein